MLGEVRCNELMVSNVPKKVYVSAKGILYPKKIVIKPPKHFKSMEAILAIPSTLVILDTNLSRKVSLSCSPCRKSQKTLVTLKSVPTPFNQDPKLHSWNNRHQLILPTTTISMRRITVVYYKYNLSIIYTSFGQKP